jgi:hypothetical protein
MDFSTLALMPSPSNHIADSKAHMNGPEALFTSTLRSSFNGQESDWEVNGKENQQVCGSTTLIIYSPDYLLDYNLQIETGFRNRAYRVTGIVTGSLYYDWKWTDASKIHRQITTFYNYENKNDQWRGTNPNGNIQYFDNDGNVVKLYLEKKNENS